MRAAVKAAALLGRGYVELDPFVAEVDLEKGPGGNPQRQTRRVDIDLALTRDGIDAPLDDLGPAPGVEVDADALG